MALAGQNERNMEKKYFPIFIDLSEKKIVVIGGGTIATRRINTLLQFVNRIVVVAPEVTPELMESERQGKITWVRGKYCFEQIAEADVVIAATNQPAVNLQVKNDCENFLAKTGRHILVNVADDRRLCDFYFPGVVQTEDFVIGISTGGSAPGRVKEIRGKIETLLK